MINEDIENRLKATILTIKKDLARSTINFTPLIFKPRAMYTKDYYNDTGNIYKLDFKGLWEDDKMIMQIMPNRRSLKEAFSIL